MHPAREGTQTDIVPGLWIIEYNDKIKLNLFDEDIELDEIAVNILRNTLSAWKNAKFHRERRTSSNSHTR